MGTSNNTPQPGGAWLTIPNVLSFARLALIPLFVWLVLADRRIVATLLLAAMAATDYLDGVIARATRQVSKLGTLLDPVSDRVLVMTAIVVLIATGDLPVWMGAPVLARDVVISVLFLLLAAQGFGGPRVRAVGKTATFCLLAALPLLVLGTFLHWPGLILFGVGGVLYFIAAYRYAQDIRAWLAARRAPST